MIDVALASDGVTLDLSADDRLLREALGARGLSTAVLPWTNEAYDWSGVRCCVPRLAGQPPGPETARDYDHWLGRVREQTSLANPLRSMRWNLHARCLVDLAKKGVRSVDAACFAQGARLDLGEELARRDARRVAVRPAHRHAGRPVVFPRTRVKTAQRHLDGVLAVGDAALVFDPPEDAPPGPTGRRSLVYLGGGFSHAVVHTGEGESGVDAAVPREDEVELARAALALIPGEPCYARVDLVRDGEDRPLVADLDVVDGPLYFGWGEGAPDRLAGELFARLAREA